MPVDHCQTEIQEAVRVLKSDGVVVFPTDTLYGLGAAVTSIQALLRVMAIKGRPAEMALPVLVADWEQVSMVAAKVPALARVLTQRFWPGPLTLVLPQSAGLSDLVTGGKGTVAVRMPAHSVPLALAKQLGVPITGTSANRSGQADLLTLGAVEASLGREVDKIIRSGAAPAGYASTVVDVTGKTPRLLRQGMLPFQEILQTCE